jgi:hypothetical protein
MLAAFFLMAAHARQSTGGRPAVSLPAILARPMEYVQFTAWRWKMRAAAASPGRCGVLRRGSRG